ncbi:spermatogenesis-associated serine-rich protein 1 [Anabas testudineus]|uniref:spermatogenesis-associated serine-rich protein 1 n=1 Tax=Anabas testudineus TaxID=64144 RepID=UPI000E45D7A4|nr:spermatogenesis-associated serine-rich protein 1 [Anabas testudineus]XP_026197459.1 spermatogenesis-associated serine-rich protein 1 [Anabas testudineus]
MERKEQDGRMLTSCLNQPRGPTVQAEEIILVQDFLCQTAEDFRIMTEHKSGSFPCHAVIGARPYCSPEYSPDFHKLGSTLPCCTYGTRTHINADTFIPLQHSTKTYVSYADKKKLLDKQEEIREVKQLDDWKPAVSIFSAVLVGFNDKST